MPDQSTIPLITSEPVRFLRERKHLFGPLEAIETDGVLVTLQLSQRDLDAVANHFGYIGNQPQRGLR